MSRLFTFIRSLLSMLAAARWNFVRVDCGFVPGFGAPSASGAARARISTPTPTQPSDRIRKALLSLEFPTLKADLRAEAHHPRNSVQCRVQLAQVVPVERFLRAIGVRIGRQVGS